MLLSWSFCTLVLDFVISADATRSSGCDRTFSLPAEAGGVAKEIKIGERNVWLTLPKNYDHQKETPLIVALHDKDQDPVLFQDLTRFSDPALNPNAVVLYPQAVDGRWLSDDQPNAKIDDKAFISELLSGISERLCIDSERMYVAGLGTGAGMVHLLACDTRFAEQVAAFVLVNPMLLNGVVDVRGVKDEISMLWGHCKPDRVPVRLMEIHGANNTVYNYWGKMSKANRKPILPTVHWLVEWAIRNECGAAYGMPTRDDPDDVFYQTTLKAGHIYEGVVYPDKLQRAIYKCWDAQDKGIPETLPEDKKQMPSLEKLEIARGSIVLEHFFVKHFNHGWPRVTWNGSKTVDMAATVIEPSDENPAFDATREALRWFDTFKLSDQARKPNPKNSEPEDPLAGLDLDEILADIGSQVEGDGLDSEDMHVDAATEGSGQDVTESETIIVDGKSRDEL